ncbi:MAG: NapC/NirT family cytochrome c [Sporomusaceae bacterium]|nr:NapC/NirT family cytochrome c [Sporomusaceae bacterium]
METCQFLNRNTLKIALVCLIVFAAAALLMGAGYAYSDSPEFCGTMCHSMEDSYQSYRASTHKQFNCTECHLPQGNVAAKMVAKGTTGMNDTYHEFFRTYPAVLKISASGKAIAQENCLRCHSSTVEKTFMANGGDDCMQCHRGLVHSIDQSKGGIRVE